MGAHLSLTNPHLLEKGNWINRGHFFTDWSSTTPLQILPFSYPPTHPHVGVLNLDRVLEFTFQDPTLFEGGTLRPLERCGWGWGPLHIAHSTYNKSSAIITRLSVARPGEEMKMSCPETHSVTTT